MEISALLWFGSVSLIVINVLFAFSIRGFTKFSRADYLQYKSENKIMPDGVNAKVQKTTSTQYKEVLVKFFNMVCSIRK